MKTAETLKKRLKQHCDETDLCYNQMISRRGDLLHTQARAGFLTKAKQDGYSLSTISDVFNRDRCTVHGIISRFCDKNDIEYPRHDLPTKRDLIVDDYLSEDYSLDEIAERHSASRKYVRETLRLRGYSIASSHEYFDGQNIYESAGFRLRLNTSNASKDRAVKRALIMKRAGDNPSQIVHFLKRELDFRASEKWVEALS